MKKIVVCSAVAIASVSFAQMYHPMTERILKITGGRLEKPGTQKGEIVYVNCQESAKKEWILEGIDHMVQMTHIKLSLREGRFEFPPPDPVGNLCIYIVDNPKYPMTLIAPEARWALVNVCPLKADKEAFFKARVLKQMSRTFAALCGAGKSAGSGTLTDPITKAEDLDTHTKDTLPLDVLVRLPNYLAPLGVTPAQVFTYINACKQGWAPQPTNDVQKAIWDKVHAIPSKPIKIEYNEKRDKGK